MICIWILDLDQRVIRQPHRQTLPTYDYECRADESWIESANGVELSVNKNKVMLLGKWLEDRETKPRAIKLELASKK